MYKLPFTVNKSRATSCCTTIMVIFILVGPMGLYYLWGAFCLLNSRDSSGVVSMWDANRVYFHKCLLFSLVNSLLTRVEFILV